MRFSQFCSQAAQQNQGCQKPHIRTFSPAPVMAELFKILGHHNSKEKKAPKEEGGVQFCDMTQITWLLSTCGAIASLVMNTTHQKTKKQQKHHSWHMDPASRIQRLGNQTNLLRADFRPLLWRLKGS